MIIHAIFEVAEQTAYRLEIPSIDLEAVEACLASYIVGEEPAGRRADPGAPKPKRPRLRTRFYVGCKPPTVDEIVNVVETIKGGKTDPVEWARLKYMAGNVVLARGELDRAVDAGRLIHRVMRPKGRAAREEYCTAAYAAAHPVNGEALLSIRSGRAESTRT